jgi:hypothetical protein
MSFSIFDVVTLLNDIPEEGLRVGMLGTIVDLYKSPVPACEVEFCDAMGRTIGQLALLPEQIRLATAVESREAPKGS